jgi:hypothetical protein
MRRCGGGSGVRVNKSSLTLLPDRHRPSRRRLGVDGMQHVLVSSERQLGLFIVI